MRRLTPGRRGALLLGVALIGLGAIGARLFSHGLPWKRDKWLQRGRAAYAAGDWPAAEKAARGRLAVARDDVEARRLLARSWFRQGRDQPALLMQSRLPADGMTAEDFFLRGQAAARQGQKEYGIVLWRRALGDDPRHVETILALERAFERLDLLHEAAGVAERLALLPGWEARASLALGRIRAEESNPDAAAEALRRALERPDEWHGDDRPERVRKRLARFLLQIGRPGEARAALAPIAPEGRADDPETCWLLGRCDLQEGTVSNAAIAEAALAYRDEHPIEPEPGPYIGETQCRACHRAVFQTQHHSRHARTFFRKEQFGAVPLPDRPVADPGDPSVLHEFERNGEGLFVRSRARERVFQTIVDYAFGSGDRGLTLVGRGPDGHPYECRLSHYPAPIGWDVTTGQPREVDRPERYQGMRINADAVRRCLVCHTTNARSITTNSGPEAADLAIGCERCHGPGGHHVKAVALATELKARGGAGAVADAVPDDLAIARPALADAPAAVALCAQCHSPRDPEFTVAPEAPESTRFQGSTFTWSRCYTESRGQFDCVTCHNPHRDVETAADHYEARCLECHAARAAPTPTPAASGLARPRGKAEGPEPGRPPSCPIQPERGCIDCHMPKVAVPTAHARFTDHFIRAHYGDGVGPARSRPGP